MGQKGRARVERNIRSSGIEDVVFPSDQLPDSFILESGETKERRRCERDKATEREETLVAAREQIGKNALAQRQNNWQ